MEVFEKSIEIQAPAEFCYRYWREFSCFSSFMHNVKDVYPLQDNVWRWVLIGPQGDESTWDLLLSEDIPSRRISWRTLSGPDIGLWVDIDFLKINSDLTQITVTTTLFPPDSPIGNLMKELFGISEQTIARNLEEFKVVVESKAERQIYQGHSVGHRTMGR
ncbi:MAG TPA: SRPBCC family protein [Coleofasciculaceae cyanobacterium]|jgi:uncharacterized membrane protein